MRLVSASMAVVALAMLAAPALASGGSRSDRLPLISIRHSGALSKDKVPGKMRIFGVQKRGYRGRIGVDLRGNSSLQFPKRSFGIELQDRDGDGRDVGLLGMAPDDDWALVPSYNDKSLMRNALALSVARQLGGWTPAARFVSLRVRRRYWGVYLLVEKPEVNSRRLDAGDRGQLFEMTKTDRELEPGAFFTPVTERPVEFKDPESDELSKRRAARLARVVARFERALYGPDAFAADGGWRAHLDERSAVDYALVMELFKNEDAFDASVYAYKRQGGGLFMGPVWDFDIAMGNSDYGKSMSLPGWMGDDRPWSERLYEDPGFVRAFAERWRALRADGLLKGMLRRIRRWERLLDGEQQRNFRRWPVLGKYVWPNPVDPATGEVRQTYAEEVDFLRAWLRERTAWIDANVDSL